MTAILPLGAVGDLSNLSQLAQLYRDQMLSGTSGTDASRVAASGAAARGADFGHSLAQGLQQLESLDKTAANKAVQAATGDLQDVHDYVIAATQVQTATELTTTVRNKALDAFNEIMRMPL